VIVNRARLVHRSGVRAVFTWEDTKVGTVVVEVIPPDGNGQFSFFTWTNRRGDITLTWNEKIRMSRVDGRIVWDDMISQGWHEQDGTRGREKIQTTAWAAYHLWKIELQ